MSERNPFQPSAETTLCNIKAQIAAAPKDVDGKVRVSPSGIAQLLDMALRDLEERE